MRVGTSFFFKRSNEFLKDHPHACGDKEDFAAYCKVSSGSSPCVWGQGDKVKAGDKLGRIIPMRVGTSILIFASSVSARDHPHACGDT